MAAYAAALPYEKQVKCYSELLEDVTVINERQRYLMLADEAGTDMHSFCLLYLPLILFQAWIQLA